ncbi:MAG TPA: SRPBCC family protein [Myxococcales bacterium]|nr:SRPBCC family protein [Myxococcales bacterium]
MGQSADSVRAVRIQACPTDVVEASPERIWELITRPENLDRWVGIKVADPPARALVVGDRIVLHRGPAKVHWQILAMDPPRELTMDVLSPLGVVNHEVIRISPVGERRTRVTFN